MRQETDGVLLESFLIYEPEHEATWFKEGKPLLGALDYEERYQVVQDVLLILYRVVKQDFTPEKELFCMLTWRHPKILLRKNGDPSNNTLSLRYKRQAIRDKI